MPDVTFVRFNQNHDVALFNKNIHVLLVASQILLASLLLVNHLIYFPSFSSTPCSHRFNFESI
jgi:hypothetical protein